MRRKSDKFQFRLLVLSMALTCALSFLAAWISYKAIRSINALEEAAGTILDGYKSRNLERF